MTYKSNETTGCKQNPHKNQTEFEDIKDDFPKIEFVAQIYALMNDVVELNTSWKNLHSSISPLLWQGPACEGYSETTILSNSNHPVGDLIRYIRQELIDLKNQINDANRELYIGASDVNLQPLQP